MTGSHRRTLKSMTCGWSATGAVREVQGKYKLHKKYCEICKTTNVKNSIPKFNSNDDAKMNGFQGLSSKNIILENMKGTKISIASDSTISTEKIIVKRDLFFKD